MKKWAVNADEALRTMQEVQQLILSLTNDLEQSQREVADIETEANQLLTCRTGDQVSASITTSTRKSRNKKEQETPFVEIELSATESAIRGLEEKKRLKVVNALTALFHLPAPLNDHHSKNSPTLSQRQTPESTIKDPRTPVVPLVNPDESSGSPGTSHTHTQLHGVNEPRRPRDVPLVLWDEMLNLRQRRIAAEEKLRGFHVELQRQMKRFKILQAMYEMSIYSCRSAKTTYQKAAEEWHQKYLQSISPPVYEGKSGRGER